MADRLYSCDLCDQWRPARNLRVLDDWVVCRVHSDEDVAEFLADTSDMTDHVSENSKSSGEANPMAEAPAEPTDAQREQAAKQAEKDKS